MIDSGFNSPQNIIHSVVLFIQLKGLSATVKHVVLMLSGGCVLNSGDLLVCNCRANVGVELN